MKKIFESRKVKNMLFIFLGIIIGTIGYVVADDVISIISANQIEFNSDKTQKKNVQAAIDELYDKAYVCTNLNFFIKKIENSTGAMVVPGTKNDTYKAIVYLDPTNLSADCNGGEIYAGGGQSNDFTRTSGCMKWYAYDSYEYNGKIIYDLILDHNIYVGDYSNSKTQLANLTTRETNAWDNKLNVRMITGQEIVNITGNSTWNKTSSSTWFYFDSLDHNPTANSDSLSKYGWLFNYTVGCETYGCVNNNSSAVGYWTSNYVGNTSNVWLVDYHGTLSSDGKTKSIGLRPVITISK